MPPSAWRAGRVGPVEALEHPLGLPGRQPGAVVDHLDGGPGPAVQGRGADPDLDRAAGRGVGERVVDQVGQDLAEPLVVAEHDQRGPGRVAVLAAEHQLDPAVGGDRPGVVDGVGGQGEQVHRVPVEGALLVEAGQQEEVLDQQAHAGRLVLDPPHQAVELGRVARPALPVQLGEAPDGGQGRAQLVAGVGDEAPHPVLGAPGRLLGPAGAGLGGGPGPEGRLDLGQHGVEGPAEPADLGAGVAVGHPPGQVAGRDRPGRLLDLDQRAQAGPDDDRPHPGQGQQHDHAHDQVDQPGAGGWCCRSRRGWRPRPRCRRAVRSGCTATRQRPSPPVAGTVAASPAFASSQAASSGTRGGCWPSWSSSFSTPLRAGRRRPGTGPGRGSRALAGGRGARPARRRPVGRPPGDLLELVVEAADQQAVEGGHAGQPDEGQGHGHQGEHGHDELDLEGGPGRDAPDRGRRPRGHGSGSRRT